MAPDADAGKSIRRADPFAPLTSEMLSVGDGHDVHVESVGRAGGIPAVYLHGGPGSGCQPDHRRLFDPERFHAVLFDQRGAGRSRPKGRREDNTTATPDRGHGADPRKIRLRALDGGRRLLGRDAGAGLCAGPSGARHRHRAARDLPRHARGNRKRLSLLAAALLSGPLRRFLERAATGRARAADRGLFPPHPRSRSRHPRSGGAGLGRDRAHSFRTCAEPHAPRSPVAASRAPCPQRRSWKRTTFRTTAS